MKEPTILDFVKALLTPWRGKPPAIPLGEDQPPIVEDTRGSGESRESVTAEIEPGVQAEITKAINWPWRSLAALALAILAQVALEPPGQTVMVAVVLYAMAAGFLLWAVLAREWSLPDLEERPWPSSMSMSVRPKLALLAAGLLPLAFLALRGNRFTAFNLTLWLGCVAATLGAFLLPRSTNHPRANVLKRLRQPAWTLTISRWTIILTVATLVVLFYRFYRLDSVLGEMFSDHAEKLLDVADVLQGRTSIFFPRNTGREALQMYLTAFIAVFARTGLSFMSLKIGTALAGLIALPFIYALGKEIGGRWVGLFAFLLAGVAYWPNVISRVGLRFPLYPMAAAPALYFLIRGLRQGRRNDFIWAGVALGIGLHGYSATRFLPFVLLLALALYWLHRQSQGHRLETLWAFAGLGLTALVIFLPLLRYMIEQPDMFTYRALTRLAPVERPYPAPVWQIFLENLWEAWIMFFYKNGNIWVHSVPNRPALDIVTAALYFLGSVLVAIRYVRRRHWLDLFLLLSVPMLMMPSILSLAFPEENPSLNRTGGAIVPVFILAALAMESVLRTLRTRLNGKLGVIISAVVGLGLFAWVGHQNFDLVFRQFDRQFMASAWNTSQIGHVVRAFADSIGTPDTAYVVPYPYWVDTRLVGIEAGYPLKDYALWPKDFEQTLSDPRAKLFIIKPEDNDSVAKLQQLYPRGTLQYYDSGRPGKDFLLFFVPPEFQGLPQDSQVEP